MTFLNADSVLGNILIAFSYGAPPCFMMVTGGLFWYLNAYLAVMLFYPVTLPLFQSKKANGRLVLLFLAAVSYGGMICYKVCEALFGTSSVSEVVPNLFYGHMLFYFILGAFLLAYREKITGFLRSAGWHGVLPYLMILFGILGILVLKYKQTGTFGWGGVHITSPYAQPPTVLISLGIYLLFMNCRYGKVMACFAKGFGTVTMGIYLIQGLMIPLVQYYTFHYLNVESFTNVPCDLLMTILITGICAAVSHLLRKIPLVRQLIL